MNLGCTRAHEWRRFHLLSSTEIGEPDKLERGIIEKGRTFLQMQERAYCAEDVVRFLRLLLP